MALADITPQMWIDDELKCEALLNVNYNSVPLLNVNSLEDLKDGRLVKFYGMVQDIFNPEYYCEKYEVLHKATNEKKLKCGKYFDILQCKENDVFIEDSENNVMGERQTAVIISVPGLNDWVHSFLKKKFTLKDENIREVSASSNKRPLESDTLINSTEHISDSSNKRKCNANSSSHNNATFVSQEHLLNFPLPNTIGKVCLAKVYKNVDGIKLNDIVEIVGFLSVDSALIENSNGEGDYDDNIMEIQTHNPPPSLIPRIHCVAWKKIDHNNCLIDSCNSSSMDSKQFLYLKNELHLILTQVLFGDTIAAEYLLYHLISKVYSTINMMALGKYALNISHIPVLQVPDYGKQLYEFIEMLVPKSYYLPMSLKNMNELTFIPKKDYECNRLTSGILQLSDNTHLILDETKLESGQLNESGIRTVAALANAIKCQKVAYDFNFYPVEFDCDIPFLILSEGKSLLPCDFHVMLKPDELCISNFEEIIAATKHLLNVDLLNNLRVYLTLARFASYQLDNSVTDDLIPSDFARMRQQGTINGEDLHNLLVLARLVCLSEGKTVLDRDSWKRACDLETERKRRSP